MGPGKDTHGTPVPRQGRPWVARHKLHATTTDHTTKTSLKTNVLSAKPGVDTHLETYIPRLQRSATFGITCRRACARWRTQTLHVQTPILMLIYMPARQFCRRSEGALQDGIDVPLRLRSYLHVQATWAVLLEETKFGVHCGLQQVCCMTKRFVRWSGVVSDVWRL